NETDRYYIFTVNESPHYQMFYAVVDTRGDGGLGAVVVQDEARHPQGNPRPSCVGSASDGINTFLECAIPEIVTAAPMLNAVGERVGYWVVSHNWLDVGQESRMGYVVNKVDVNGVNIWNDPDIPNGVPRLQKIGNNTIFREFDGYIKCSHSVLPGRSDKKY